MTRATIFHAISTQRVGMSQALKQNFWSRIFIKQLFYRLHMYNVCNSIVLYVTCGTQIINASHITAHMIHKSSM